MLELEKLMKEAEDAMYQTITSTVDAEEEAENLLEGIFPIFYTNGGTTTEQEKRALSIEKTAKIFAQCEENM